MMAACVDRQLIMPTAEQWIIRNGAYRDGQDIVLPVIGSSASIYLPVGGSVSTFSHMPNAVFMPSGGNGKFLRSANYFAQDRITSVTPTLLASGNAVPVSQTDKWVSVPVWVLQPGPAVRWLLLTISVASSYGVPGTRFRPGPSDITVTRL